MLKGFTILVVSVPSLRAPGIVLKDPVVLVSEMEKNLLHLFSYLREVKIRCSKIFSVYT